jgi:ABC-type glycerol-3-phosphate transport system substrate-binding protein
LDPSGKNLIFKKFIIAVFIVTVSTCAREEKTVVTFWHVMGGPLGKKLDELIEDFNKLHAEGRVQSVHMGSYDVLAQKLMGAVASNSPPVLAQMYESWTDQFYQAGVLLAFENFVRVDTGFLIDDFFPVFIDDNTYDSVLVTLPFNKSVPVFYYNRDILDSLGINRFPEDWTDFRTVCELIRQTHVWPTSWPIDVWYFSTMLYQAGGRLYDETAKEPLFNSRQGVAVLDYLIGLVQDSLFYLNPGFQGQDEFLAGNVAMIPASVVSWAFIKGKPTFRMGVAPLPVGRYKTTVIAGTNVGLFRKSTEKQRLLAWEFVRWFLEPETQARWTEASYYLPTRRRAIKTQRLQEFLAANPGYEKIIGLLDSARTEPKVKEWFAGRIYLNEALEQALRLEKTSKKALDEAAQRLDLEARQ